MHVLFYTEPTLALANRHEVHPGLIDPEPFIRGKNLLDITSDCRERRIVLLVPESHVNFALEFTFRLEVTGVLVLLDDEIRDRFEFRRHCDLVVHRPDQLLLKRLVPGLGQTQLPLEARVSLYDGVGRGQFEVKVIAIGKRLLYGDRTDGFGPSLCF